MERHSSAGYSVLPGWHKAGKEYQGIRTTRHTYVRSLRALGCSYDQPLPIRSSQKHGADPSFADVRDRLDDVLQAKLQENDDRFLPGGE